MSNLGRLVACASLLLVFPLHAAQLPDAPAGAVRFYNVADADFDGYSQSPSTSAQQWMRARYARMQTYTPYFDTRLSWYPGGWAYKNIFGVAVGSTVAVQHPEWLLRDASGNLLYIDWGCSGGRCPLYAADFGNAAYRTYWVSEAKALIAKGYKGLWIDDVDMDFRTSNGNATRVIPSDPRTGQAMTLTNWRRYMAEILEQVRAAIPGAELAHNAIWFAANSLTDGYIRRQIDAADYINLERGATDGGLVYGAGQWGFETFLAYVDFIHARGRSVIMMDYGTTTTDREFGLAGMLLANQGRDMLSSNQLAWTAPDRWWSGYDTHLGESNGLRYKWNGLLRRDFQCGMVLANQPGASSISVTLPSAFTTLEGTQVTSVTLGARQAKVLKSACTDGGIPDEADNCTLEENPTQCDSDGDGYGNHCDGDLDNNTFTNAQDDILFRAQLGRASVAPTYNEADLNCNGFVNAEDYILFRSRLGKSSGPSGLRP